MAFFFCLCVCVLLKKIKWPLNKLELFFIRIEQLYKVETQTLL